MRVKVLTQLLKISVFWNMKPCILIDIYQKSIRPNYIISKKIVIFIMQFSFMHSGMNKYCSFHIFIFETSAQFHSV